MVGDPIMTNAGGVQAVLVNPVCKLCPQGIAIVFGANWSIRGIKDEWLGQLLCHV